jgi:hypothetical protein
MYKETKLLGNQRIDLTVDRAQRYKFEALSKTNGAIFRINQSEKPIVIVESFIDACSLNEAYPKCSAITIFNDLLTSSGK